MTLTFCGAAREVTGSAHLLTLDNGYRILLDCGLYQGRNDDMEHFNENWRFDPADIDALVLSHAHIDHSGRIPKLVRDGFRGKIYSTHATRSLCAILLLDSAFIQEKDAEYFNRKHKKTGQTRRPLYGRPDVKPAMERFVALPYNTWQEIRPGVELQFRDAGHILGSASVTLRIRDESGQTTTVGFTGDVGRPDRPILRDPQKMPHCDFLISEATYGDREHESPPNEMRRFLQVIQDTCVTKGGKLLIPAFSVGRTQEIVYMLDQLESSGQLPRIPVFVDSPLAVDATTVFGAHPECYDLDLQEYLLTDDDPFGFSRLTYTQSVAESKALNFLDGPAIIISASGMMNAGRSKHHLANTMSDPRNTIFIVGYCAPGTPGGRLREGAEGLKLFGKYHPLRAEIVTMDSFSAHADRSELINFLNGQQDSCEKVFLVHGTLDRMEPLGESLTRAGFREVIMPQLGDEVAL
ncbi:metallo-beta-lactamase family protein [Lewinella marina]|uniref:MBL fold metallo-hydrolase n=1 Tax=Neolewinella marina TaxID=438751 RepID=A0A2G0CC18_9BACT|nr:MBL fold metallo-hydrolase [Neolewinella marina]NJB86699.1 metallo-beta-lactamase family protein [Neolewinella marina]PHK97506.1 MBL fold metallo-hydrolase [Neolewinella marina]